MDSAKKRRRGSDEGSNSVSGTDDGSDSFSGSASHVEVERQAHVALMAEQTALYSKLSVAVKDLSQRAIFAVGGSVTVSDDGVDIYYRNKPTTLASSSSSASVFSLSSTSTIDQATALSSLCLACEPAPFGLNHQTIHDPTRRFLSYSRGYAALDIAFWFTLVCLPVAFTGGLLTIEHDNNQSVWDWSSNRTLSSSLATTSSSSSSSSSSAISLQWCAFFSDCAHWIDRVESGHRITLTYNLFMESVDENEPLTNNQSTLPPPPPHLPDSSTAFQTFAQLVRSVCSQLPKGAVLGYYTQHGYAHTANAAQKDKRLRPSVLKGADALVWAAVTHAKLRCQFQAVVNQTPADDDEGAEADTNSKLTYVQQTFKEISDAWGGIRTNARG